MAIAALDKEEAEKAGGVWNVVGVTGVQGRMRLVSDLCTPATMCSTRPVIRLVQETLRRRFRGFAGTLDLRQRVKELHAYDTWETNPDLKIMVLPLTVQLMQLEPVQVRPRVQ